MNSGPLISIGIISYNNASHISECIESCLSQTYKNTEIIIADDGSTDNSVQIIEEYARLYSSKITLISSQKNCGIAINFNKAVKASKGEWFKPIACDDVLLNDCIENYMKEIFKLNLTNGILFSKMSYIGLNSKKNILTEIPEIFALNSYKKIESILIDNTLPAPTAFFNMNTIYELGLCNENYPFLEDYPLWLKAILNNVDLEFVDIISVKYRHHDSISKPKNKIGNSKFYKSKLNFLQNEIWHRRSGLSKLKNIDDFISIGGTLRLIKIFSNKKTSLYLLLSFFLRFLKPYSIIKKILMFLNFSK